MNTQNPQREKSPSYLEQSIKEMKDLLRQCDTTDEMEGVMREFMQAKIRESFKNGIEVGKKKAQAPERQGQSTGKPWRKPYSKR